MLVIRLLRVGKANQPLFRLVITDKKNSSKSGRFLDIVGSYSSVSKKAELNKDRIKHWISVGAQPSPTVQNLLIKEKIIEGKKIPKQKKSKKPLGQKPTGEVVDKAKESVSAEATPVIPASEEVKPSEPAQTPASEEAPQTAAEPHPAPITEENKEEAKLEDEKPAEVK